MSKNNGGTTVSKELIWIYKILYANHYHSSQKDGLSCTFREKMRITNIDSLTISA
jgi:hypothetical protein